LIDRDATKKAIEAIEKHGIPDLQVIYFPGIDIFTHAAEDPLESQVRYLELVTDPTVGKVLDEYAEKSQQNRIGRETLASARSSSLPRKHPLNQMLQI